MTKKIYNLPMYNTQLNEEKITIIKLLIKI